MEANLILCAQASLAQLEMRALVALHVSPALLEQFAMLLLK
jgi:hypothetical protein